MNRTILWKCTKLFFDHVMPGMRSGSRGGSSSCLNIQYCVAVVVRSACIDIATKGRSCYLLPPHTLRHHARLPLVHHGALPRPVPRPPSLRRPARHARLALTRA